MSNSPFISNDQFFQALRILIDSWCKNQNLIALSCILGPYLSFNGMTDGWGELAIGLKSIRAQCHYQADNKYNLTTPEEDSLHDLIRATDNILYQRN